MIEMDIKRVLVIAGSDCSGGAGVQADLKTLTSFGVYGMSAITALTAQNTMGVHQIENVSFDFIEKQIDVCLSDIGVDAIKIGMVHKAEIFKIIFNALKKYSLINHKKIKIVLDPVMFSKGGQALLEKEAISSLIEFVNKTRPILTPNIPEAELLSRRKINNKKEMIEASKVLLKMGINSLVLKGGHLDSKNLVDMVFYDNNYHEFNSKKVLTRHTHGTGCTLSSAIAANIAKSLNIVKSMEIAHQYVLKGIQSAPKFGKGQGPINHFQK